MKKIFLAALAVLFCQFVDAQKFELLPFGDMNSWVTREIKESAIIGGDEKKVYAIGPNTTVRGAVPYRASGGSPWASSNVMARVAGITKTSNAVFPEVRSGANRCAKLTTMLENCRAIGIINIDVLVSGSIFLGEMLEPIKSTSDPYSKMDMGIPFTKRPKALRYDYKLTIPSGEMIYAPGFGRKRTIRHADRAEVVVLLQRRWEDAEGNLHAKRVGTGRELLARSTSDWVNGHSLPIYYGDISHQPYYRSYMGLLPADKSYCARNSQGKNVPVIEEGWDSADATPTHLIVLMSSGSGAPYTGAVGTTFCVDNVGLVY